MNTFRHGSYKLALIALFAMLLHSLVACADDIDAPIFSFSGFGTLGLAHSSEDEADFNSSIFKPGGAGHSHTWSADVDSLIAGQVTANFTPQLSAVVQVVSEQNQDNTYRPQVEWANIKYEFTPDFSVRVGRTVLPAFLLSDAPKLGYAYAWVRPPLEVYGLLPVTYSDGLDISYRLHLGDLVNTTQVNTGSTDYRLVNNTGTTQARNSWGISDTAEYGALTVRITYQKADLTIASLNTLFDAFRQFGPQGAEIADKYDSDRKLSASVGIGADYDPGNWFVMTEWGYGNTHSFIGKKSAWYASGGYRFGNFTPYLTYAQARADNLSDPGLDLSILPPNQIGPANGLNGALNSLLSTKPVQNTISIGVRWDLVKNADLKLQFDHTRIGAGSTGVLHNIQPGFQLGDQFDVISAALDFVF